MVSSFFSSCVRLACRPFAVARKAVREQRRKLREEVLAVKGLMPLLMKRRNGERWSRDDRNALRCHLRRLTAASPYLMVLMLPGGLFLVPVLAWWLDRRRNRRAAEDAVQRLHKM